MKPHISVFFVFVLFLASCQAIQPTLAPTPMPTLTLVPTSTRPLPTSTNIPEPSPTPIVLPGVINQTFSGVSIEYRDSFEYTMDGMVPSGWTCDEKSAAWVTKDDQFKIQPKDEGDWSGTIFYFSKAKMTPDKAVYLTFMYTGDQEGFTLGFDALRDNGQLIMNGQKGYYSVAMELLNDNLSAHIIQGTFLGEGHFKGNFNLQQNTWYDMALGFDDKENYIIKIWDPNNLIKQLTYVRNWKGFPKNYFFISWISAKRSLLIDDFTVIKFDSIILE